MLDGSGFCDGTKVRVGNDLAEAAATVHDGGRTLRFKTPRLATPGPITILPPHGAAYKTADLEVDTFRSTRGLSFANYDYAGFSFEEAVDTFGAEELFQRINLCWPLKCIVRTPIPDVKALAVVQIIDWAMQNSAGHCFGIARAVQGWAHNPASLRRFTTGNAFSLTKTGSVERLPRRPARDPGVVAVPRRVVPALEGPAHAARADPLRALGPPAADGVRDGGRLRTCRPGLRHHRPARRKRGRARPRQQRPVRRYGAGRQRVGAQGPHAASERDPDLGRPLELGARHGRRARGAAATRRCSRSAAA